MPKRREYVGRTCSLREKAQTLGLHKEGMKYINNWKRPMQLETKKGRRSAKEREQDEVKGTSYVVFWKEEMSGLVTVALSFLYGA